MIEIINIELMATLQGKPYRGNRQFGMPLSGPADPISMAIANRLVDNTYDAVSIELSVLGGTVKTHKDIVIGIAGPVESAIIERDSQTIKCDHFTTIVLQKNDVLTIRALREGAHIYLSIHGGFDADHYWDGNSTFLPAKIGGHSGRALQRGDYLNYKQSLQADHINNTPERYRLSYNNQHVMRICIEDEKFADYLSQRQWNIGRQGSRIGYELLGSSESIDISYDGFSRAVFSGTIQYPPSGNPFLLGVDAQTTGGYPIIGQVIRADRHIIGQIKSGDSLRFITQKPCEARRVYKNKLIMWREYIPDLQLD